MKNATRDVNFGCRVVNFHSVEGQPLLAQVAEEVLRGVSGVPELLDAMDATARELQAERDRMRAWLAAESAAVRDTLRVEVRATEESFFDFLEWVRACQGYAASFDAGQLTEVAQALPVVARRLQLDCLRLHRGLWSARGPGTHAGVNRLLHRGDDFEVALAQELHFLEAELEALPASIPSALLEPQRELLEEAADWMRAAANNEEGAWVAQGEEWSLHWASLDLAFLAGRFSEAPTRFPSLNLTINAAWLRCEERVDPRLVACCLEAAGQSLRDLPLNLQAHHEQSDTQASALADLESLRDDLADALTALAAWNVRGSVPGFEPIRNLLVELSDELWQHLESFPDDDPPREADAG